MFWALQLWEANTILILFWTEIGQTENVLIAPRMFMIVAATGVDSGQVMFIDDLYVQWSNGSRGGV